MVDKFEGKVIWHPQFGGVVTAHPKVQQEADAFKDYWATGFNPNIGRDYVMTDPLSYGLQAIGHAHIRPQLFPNKSFSSSKQCWDKWANGSGNVEPTSNTFIVYCVDSYRNVCLLSYLDGNHIDSHVILRSASYRAQLVAVSDSYYASYKQRPLSMDQFDNLFSVDWL